jgi:hypothetical protein
MPKRRSEYEKAQSAVSDPRATVAADLSRLKGYSVGPEALTSDAGRGAKSALGSGSHSKDAPKRKHEAKKGGKK